jgi:hypothetical protein
MGAASNFSILNPCNSGQWQNSKDRKGFFAIQSKINVCDFMRLSEVFQAVKKIKRRFIST